MAVAVQENSSGFMWRSWTWWPVACALPCCQSPGRKVWPRAAGAELCYPSVLGIGGRARPRARLRMHPPALAWTVAARLSVWHGCCVCPSLRLSLSPQAGAVLSWPPAPAPSVPLSILLKYSTANCLLGCWLWLWPCGKLEHASACVKPHEPEPDPPISDGAACLQCAGCGN